ncbi:50S ribosomal protein L11 methyltransferase [Desulfuribacillus alkaliarsenatis]|uniref:Ribosomal protein L11 methyltransferase n=1 Tax=Desulfuribacillus alkaliarsenatis TaxID=766136 RepID=A0A1E5G0Q3_9FIRM|nr:ribosomal protein L11 methyltransferase [Desulfuribacillus alkaliarsenatis]
MWSEIRIHTTNEAVEAVSNILHEAGAGGVVIEDSIMLDTEWDTNFGEMYELSVDDYPDEGVYVKAYLPVDSSLPESIEQIKLALDKLMLYDIDYGPGTVEITEINEEDWATSWKKYYKPISITERITITPTWEDYQQREDELVIELDPGMAFGTGTHPTTKLCIIELEKYVKEGDTVYDVGCGSGVLSIAAAKLGASNIQAFDIDTVAVSSAEINAKLNDVEEVINARQNNLLEGIEQPVDIIVANIIAEIIIRFAKDVPRLLKKDGFFIASGIIIQKEVEVIDALEAQGLTIVEKNYENDWMSIVAQKVS